MRSFRWPRSRARLYLTVLLAAVALALIKELIEGTGDDRPDTVSGSVRVIDGDSFRLAGDELRLVGIDAPEGRQTCRRAGRDWRCGEASADRLRQLVKGRDVRCDVEGRDRFDRLLATCFAGPTNLNRLLVAEGWAVAYGDRYLRMEREAKAKKRGLWASEFETPRTWRDRNQR